jgi:hypothetical protein
MCSDARCDVFFDLASSSGLNCWVLVRPLHQFELSLEPAPTYSGCGSPVVLILQMSKKQDDPKKQETGSTAKATDSKPSAKPVGGLSDKDLWGEGESESALDSQIAAMDNSSLEARIRLFESNCRIMTSETKRFAHEKKQMEDKIKENNEKIKMNKQLPYLVANVVEVSSLLASSLLPSLLSLSPLSTPLPHLCLPLPFSHALFLSGAVRFWIWIRWIRRKRALPPICRFRRTTNVWW